MTGFEHNGATAGATLCEVDKVAGSARAFYDPYVFNGSGGVENMADILRRHIVLVSESDTAHWGVSLSTARALPY